MAGKMSTDEEVIGEIIEYDELEDEDEEFEDKDISTFVHLSPSLGSTNSALHSVMQDEDYYKLTERNLKVGHVALQSINYCCAPLVI